MKADTLVSVEEYLSASYHPDRDYIEGRLVERNAGEVDHSDVQSSVLFYIRTKYKSLWAGVEVRVQVMADRFRVPDVTIVRGGKPEGRIITEPPALIVEILSKDDRWQEFQERIDDYLAFGVPCVWIINPITRRVHVFTDEGSREVKDGVLRADAAGIELPLADLFG